MDYMVENYIEENAKCPINERPIVVNRFIQNSIKMFAFITVWADCKTESYIKMYGVNLEKNN